MWQTTMSATELAEAAERERQFLAAGLPALLARKRSLLREVAAIDALIEPFRGNPEVVRMELVLCKEIFENARSSLDRNAITRR